MTAKTETIAQAAIDLGRPRDIGNIIKIAFRIGCFVVDRGWNHTIANGFHTEDQLHRAGRGDHVPHAALGAACGDLVGVFAKHMLDADGFDPVVDLGAGSMGVDVLDFLGTDARVLKRPRDARDGRGR